MDRASQSVRWGKYGVYFPGNNWGRDSWRSLGWCIFGCDIDVPTSNDS